jgi:glycosyltransferase involved in cell wall biosynthesis
MKKKILYVVNTDKFFFSHRINIAYSLKKNFKIYLATNFLLGEDFFKKKGFETYQLTIDRSSFGFLSNFYVFLRIFLIIKKCKPDLIHFISIKPVLLGGLASKFFNIPKIFSITGLGFVFIGNNLISEIRKIFFLLLYKISLGHRCLKVIFQNRTDYLEINKFSSIKEKNYKLIPGSGICLKKFRPQKQKNKIPIVMFPSRMLYHKGLKEFVNAAEILNKDKINAKFVLVGELDASNPACVNLYQINKWKLDGVIEYWGHKSKMHKILNLSTIIVLPSYREGFPKVLMEAAACGKPVITTNVPGCRDAVINNVTGKIVPVKNSKLLAIAIRNLLENKHKMKLMSKNARKHAEKNFSVKRITKMHLEIYQSLIK